MDAQYKVAVSKYAFSAKIPSGDPFWPTFNGSFQNTEMSAKALANSIYAGYPFTTWHKNQWRVTENYILGQHLGLDFDNGDETSTLPHLLKDKFISRYGAFLYTTVSHTPEHPRARAVFLLDQPIQQAKNYTLAAAALLWLFGTADRQCKDAVRFFYGARGCEMEFIDQVLPLEVVKKLIAEYQETGLREKKRQQRSYSAPADQHEVADALRHIPAMDIDYDQWVQVLMGIHAEFGEAGFMLADSWAQGKPGEVEQKWRSFKKSGSAGAVTIGTVFGLAKEYGWRKGALH